MHNLDVASKLSVCVLFWSCLLWVVNSSNFNLQGHRPLKRPRYVHARDSISPVSSNTTWPKFPYAVLVEQPDSNPAWMHFFYGGQSGTQQQALILYYLIGNLSATLSNSPTDILGDMSTVGYQNVHLNFRLTPVQFTGRSFSLALQNLAGLVHQWGAKEMDFDVSTGDQIGSTEGVFQVRLSQGLFTAGTGVSTALPFSTLFQTDIPETASQASTVASQSNSRNTSVSSATNIQVGALSTGSASTANLPLSQPSGRATGRANSTMSYSLQRSSTLSAGYSPSQRSLASQSGIPSSGYGPMSAGNSTGNSTHRSTIGTGNSGINQGTSIRSSPSGTQVSLTTRTSSTGCTAGLCPQLSNSTGYSVHMPTLGGSKSPFSSSSVRESLSGLRPPLSSAPISADCTAGLCPQLSNLTAYSTPALTSSGSSKVGQASSTVPSLSTGCTAGLCPLTSNSSQYLGVPTSTPYGTGRNLARGQIAINSLSPSSQPGMGGTNPATISSTGNSTASSLPSSIISSPVSSLSSSIMSSSALSSSASSGATLTSLTASQTLANSITLPQSTTAPPSLSTTGFTTKTGLSTIESSIGVSTAGFTTISSEAAGIGGSSGGGGGDGGGLHFPFVAPIVFPVDVPVPVPIAIIDPLVEPLDPETGKPDPEDPEDPEDPDDNKSLESQTVASTVPTRTPVSSTVFSSPSLTSLTASMSSTITSSAAPSSTGSCLGFSFNQGYPWPLDGDNVTNGPDMDHDDEDYDPDYTGVDPDPDDGDVDLGNVNLFERDLPTRTRKRMAIAGRIYLDEGEDTLVKRASSNKKVKEDIGSCSVKPYTAKPVYPLASQVRYEEKQKNKPPNPRQEAFWATATKVRPSPQPNRMDPFFSTATYWAIATDTPPQACILPGWGFMSSDQAEALSPAWVIGGNTDTSVNVDHIYETHFLTEFLEDSLDKGTITCDMISQILDQTDAAPGAPLSDPSNPSLGVGTRLNTLFSKLAGFVNAEFVGMGNTMNNLKERMVKEAWAPSEPLPFNGIDPTTGKNPAADVDIFNLARMAIVLDITNQPYVITLFERTNARIYKAFQSIDTLAENQCFNLPTTFWSDAYKNYMTTRLTTLNQALQAKVSSAAAGIHPTDIPQDPGYFDRFLSKYPLAAMTHPVPQDWDAGLPPVTIAKRQVAGTAGGAACPKPTSAGPGSSTPILSAVAGQSAALSSSGPVSRGFGQVAINSVEPPPLQSSMISSSSLSPTSTSQPPSAISAVPSLPAAHSELPIGSSSLTSSTPAASPTNGDPCGPKVQESGFPNTCNAKVELTTTVSQYGVYCGSSGSGNLVYAMCSGLYSALCKTMQHANFPTAAWVWADGGDNCAVGVWVPAPQGAAMIPSVDRCENSIYAAMAGSCSNPSQLNNVASVNLATLPSFSDKTQTGSQVNAGYPSYILAPKSPVGLSATWAGWTTASVQTEEGGLNPLDQDQDAADLAPNNVANPGVGTINF